MSKKKFFLIGAVIILLSFPVYVTEGSSMLGGIHDKDILVGSYFQGNLKFGDIIVFEQGEEQPSRLVKRVIGVAGDKVQIKDNVLSVNGVVKEENYLYERMLTDDIDVTVPQDSVFVMGDNRNVSYDSRDFGCVSEDNILSKVICDFTAIFR